MMLNILTDLALLNNVSSNSAFFVNTNLTVQQNMKMHSFELKTFMLKHRLTGKSKGNHLESTSLQNCGKSLNLIMKDYQNKFVFKLNLHGNVIYIYALT